MLYMCTVIVGLSEQQSLKLLYDFKCVCCFGVFPDNMTLFDCYVVLSFLSTGVYFYQRSKKQKKLVLDELRDGLLRNTEGGNNEYIQYMQQALILNDVFVKFEEIKLEEKIGEGSFGVVHKGECSVYMCCYCFYVMTL